MTRMRVYEYAKKMNMSSKEVLTILERMELPVKNHMSIINEDMVKKVEEFFESVKKTVIEKKKPVMKEFTSPSAPNVKKEERTKPKEAVTVRPLASAKKDEKNKQSVVARVSSAQNSSGKARPSDSETSRNTNPPRKKDASKSASVPTSQDEKKKLDEKRGKKDFSRKNKAPSGKSSNEARGTHYQRRNRRPHRNVARVVQPPVLPKEIEVSESLTVGEFAKRIRREASDAIKKLMKMGVMATINQEIDVDTMTLLGEEYGVKVIYKEVIDESIFEDVEEEDNAKDMQERPPIVTIMGHVDHGKTTLLDSIRKTSVTKGEAGGITQHIGAYQVEVNKKKITFLDTPGHAAFTTMRARGAQVTDITILVVSADDGVMPQTIEAINHAKAAEVPIIIAVNKMDKPEANPDRVKQQLMEYGLVSEEWGGDTIFVGVSALTGEGLDTLLEMVLLVSEVQEYKANPNKRARGIVIEAELDKGRGPVATILVQNGTLKVGDAVVAGNFFGKVRAMMNDKGRRVKEALPSMPVSILGLSDVPGAGDPFMVFDEKQGKAIAEKRALKQKEEDRSVTSRVTLDDLFKHIQEGQIKELNVIIKADVQGSAEAMKSSLEKIEVEDVRVKIIHSGVGAITESDIILASASNAIIVGFNVRVEPKTRALAEQEKVDIRLHRVIYNAITEIESAVKGLLDPEFKEKDIGMCEVRQVFKVSKVGTIAGCYVTEGKIMRDAKVRLLRDSVVVHEGKLDTLKRFKDDAKEVSQGYECGITLEGYNDIKEGDVIEAYIIEEIERV